MQIAFEKLKIDHEKNPRGDITKLDRYTKPDGVIDQRKSSIEALGLLEPLIVRQPKTKDEPYELIDGYVRAAAIERIRETDATKFTRVEVVCKDGNSAARRAMALAANVCRDDMDAVATAEALRAQINAGKTQTDIAAECGRTPGWVSRLLKLLDAEPVVLNAVRAGTLDTQTALLLSELPAEAQAEALKQAIEAKAEAKAARKGKKRAPRGSKSAAKRAALLNGVRTAEELQKAIDAAKMTVQTAGATATDFLPGAVAGMEFALRKNDKFA